MEKQKIFFSYSRADGSAFALRLAVDLKKKGFDVWIDQEDIRAGLDWDLEIEKALKSCDCVLFLETEKSVVSDNVLDEVYYALEQNKRVIPLVYVDSKTPFRLNRLQHIDFTKNYDTALGLLVNELQGSAPVVTYTNEEKPPETASNKAVYSKNYRVWMIIACIAVLATTVIFFTTKKKAVAPDDNKDAIVLTDTINKTTDLPDAPITTNINNKEEAEDKKSSEKLVPVASKKKDQNNKTSGHSANMNEGLRESIGEKKKSSSGFLNETVAGDWRLVDVKPKAQSQQGYLKIEALSENKATIKSYIQFYYPDSKASSYLTIFNAFTGCTSCIVTKEMKLNVEDISVGSRTIKKLQEDGADGRKAGDVIMDANSNKSVRGKVTLQFVDNNNAIIKLTQPLTIALANELMLEPFVYTFHFKKTD